ncbi:hypothetical protein [Fusobacterium polymorphum]|uniref:hypothetical protein n=1 Tax=Fusobacterium nucleatum subsp. polymorphum TaxID=76857 RepID=UPI00300B683E
MYANVEKVIKECENNLTTHYDMTTSQIENIRDNSNDIYEMMCKAFKFGFGQGMKCQKKRGKVKK